MVAENPESNKFDDAFDAFGCEADLVIGQHYDSNKFYDAFDAVHSNADLWLQSTTNGTNCMMLLIRTKIKWWKNTPNRANSMMVLMLLVLILA